MGLLPQGRAVPVVYLAAREGIRGGSFNDAVATPTVWWQ
jgi:hypothetical protein